MPQIGQEKLRNPLLDDYSVRCLLTGVMIRLDCVNKFPLSDNVDLEEVDSNSRAQRPRDYKMVPLLPMNPGRSVDVCAAKMSSSI